MKKFSNLNKIISNEEIEDYFYEYLDNKQIKIIDGYLSPDNRFFTGIGKINNKCKKSKKITISIPNAANGIYTYSSGKCLTDFDKVSKILNGAKVFFLRTKYPINYQIDQYLNDLQVIIYLIGELAIDHLNIKDEINELLTKLSEILKLRYRPKLRTGSIEVKSKNADYLSTIFHRIDNGEEYFGTPLGKGVREWVQNVNEKGYRVFLSGGNNHQVIIQLTTNNDNN